jgi:hypothetical protein
MFVDSVLKSRHLGGDMAGPATMLRDDPAIARAIGMTPEQRLHELTHMDREDRVGGLRSEILNSINNEGDPYGLAVNFEEMTPMELALGKLYGKLMNAKGNVQVDNAFAWWETEYSELLNGQPLNDFNKNMILVSVIQQLVGANPDGIRVLRKVLVTLNTK